MKKLLPILAVSALLFSSCKKSLDEQNSLPEKNPLSAEAIIQNGRLSFRNTLAYEQFLAMTGTGKENFITSLPGSDKFFSFKKRKVNMQNQQARTINGCEVPEELVEDNPVFFNMINAEGIVEIGGTLYRYDYCNDMTWAISTTDATNGTYYSDFMNGTPRVNIVGAFPNYVDAIEAVAQGYKTMPDTNTVQGNEVFEKLPTIGSRGVEYFYIKSDPKQPGIENVLMDGNLQYDKFAVYFHFYGKEKYRTPCFFNWCTATDGNRDWNVSFTYTYHRKGQNNPQSGSATIYPPSSGENKCDKTFYEGNRGLRDGRNNARWNVNQVYTKGVRILRGENPGGLNLVGSYSLNSYQYRNNYQFPGSIDKPYVIRF